MCQSLALSSTVTYNTGQRAFGIFCELHALDPLEPSEKTLCEFGAWLHGTRRVDGATVNSYITAVRSGLIDAGVIPFDRDVMPRLNRVTKGCARNYALLYKGEKRLVRLPITLEILRKMYASIGNCSAYDETLLWAAITMAFGAFLRSEEYTRKRVGKVETTPPLLSSIKFVDGEGVAVEEALPRLIRKFEDEKSVPAGIEGLSFFVSKSKTDQMMDGHWVHLSKPQDISVCAVTALLRNLSARSKLGLSLEPGSWLLMNKDVSPLFYTQMMGGMRDVLKNIGVNPLNYGTHSLRIGAATMAARNGVPEHIIQKMGRWDSMCYRIYIRMDVKDRIAASSSMYGGDVRANGL